MSRWGYYRLTDASGQARKYGLDDDEVRRQHARLCALGDRAFLRRAKPALHLATFLAWVRGDTDSLSDIGAVHELVHVVTLNRYPYSQGDIDLIRKAFASLRPTRAALRAFRRRVGVRRSL